jgi:hypothetical protein
MQHASRTKMGQNPRSMKPNSAYAGVPRANAAWEHLAEGYRNNIFSGKCLPLLRKLLEIAGSLKGMDMIISRAMCSHSFNVRSQSVTDKVHSCWLLLLLPCCCCCCLAVAAAVASAAAAAACCCCCCCCCCCLLLLLLLLQLLHLLLLLLLPPAAAVS